MDPREFAVKLIEGSYVLVEDYYYSGLQVLEQLKKLLKSRSTDKSFQGQRKYRAAYKDASHKLLLIVADNKLKVRKSPDIGWLKILYPDHKDFFISFPDVQGLNSSWQWYIKGIEIPPLDLYIYPYYGVYFPTRFDHLHLFSDWLAEYSGDKQKAVDVGVGSGLLSFQLIKAGFSEVIGTDNNPNALISTAQDAKRLGYEDQLTLHHGDLFVKFSELADLVVFNPPWLRAQHQLEPGIDQAIYYEDDLFQRFFETAKRRLTPNGRVILLFSSLGKVVGGQPHPVQQELREQNRFEEEIHLKQSVKPSSKKTRRKSFRKDEKVELWVLKHKS